MFFTVSETRIYKVMNLMRYKRNIFVNHRTIMSTLLIKY